MKLAYAPRMRNVVWCGLIAVAFGCGSSGVTATESADAGGDTSVSLIVLPKTTGHDAGKHTPVDATLDAPAAPPACGSPDASSAEACGTLSFITSPVSSRPRNHHVTLTTETPSGTMLYAIGGANADEPIGFVDRVLLQADGSLGAWVQDLSLPIDAGGLVGEIVAGVLVVGGGTTPSFTATDEVFSSVLNADGSLVGWQPAPPFNEARMHAGSISKGSTVWVLGGFSGPSIWSDIISATVSSDGTVSAWQPAGELPTPLSHFTINLVGDDIYLTGGLQQSAGGDDNPPDVTNTWHGQIQSDGTLGGWVAQSPLLVAEAAHAGFVYGGYLNVCGGINNVPAEEDRCWRAPIGGDRSLGTFEEIDSLPLARGHVHQMPVVGSFVYSIAGAIDFNLDSTTEIFIGSWATDAMGGAKKAVPRAVRPSTPGPVPKHGAKCHLHH
jgi:hypothetical protein